MDSTPKRIRPAVAEARQTGEIDRETVYRLRCPSCGDKEDYWTRADAATFQRTTPCPDCDRMRALSRCRA